MNKDQYTPVTTTEGNEDAESRTSFFRQLLVCSGALSIYFCVGICYGAPTIFIQQMRDAANSTDAVSMAMASNLSSMYGYASIPWIFLLTAISHYCGRKKSLLIVGLCTVAMFTCFYFSVTTTHLLIVTFIEGIPNATTISISIVIITEFTSPEYRGIFLTMKVASVFWGIWFANAIGTFFHWKYIALFGLVCSLYSLTAFFWPESPHWLASKRRLEECRNAHRWLKGCGPKAEKELEKLTSGNEILAFGSFSQIKKKEFYRPTLISCLMILQYYSSGKKVCSIYSIEILKKVTTTESAAYSAMLIIDGVTLVGMYVGCFLNGVLKRRVQFLTTSTISIFFLYIISLYLYLIRKEIIAENNVLTILLLVIFSIAMGCGPAIMAPSIFGELIPSKYKNMCTIIVAIFYQAMNSTLLKIFPYIYLELNLHGCFLCYAVCMSVLTIALYKVLPETKDKTMHEINEYFKSF